MTTRGDKDAAATERAHDTKARRLARRRRSSSATATTPDTGFIEDPRGLAWAVALVALAVVLVDGSVLSAQAISFDDASFIQWNPIVGRPGWRSITQAFSEVAHPSTVRGYYIPLTMCSLMVDYALGARSTHLNVFHATSLALHLGTTLLFMLALHGMFRRIAPAALGALVFALHPLTVEPLAWVAERKTLLATFFALASLAAHVARARWPRHTLKLFALSLASYGLAVLSKPTATPLPVLLLLLDVWPLQRPSARAALEKLPFFAIAGVSAVVTYQSHEASAGLPTQADGGMSAVGLAIAHNLGFYLEKFLWPVRLTSVYARPEPFTLENPVVLRRLLLVLASGIGALALVRRTRGPLVGLAFFAVALGPTLGVVQFSWVTLSDKYAYMPVIGLLLPLTAGLAWLWNETEAPARLTHRRALVGACALLLVALALRTRSQLALWRDTETLMRHMVALAPESAHTHSMLGNALLDRDELAEAEREHARALALLPSHPYVWLYYMRAVERRGDAERALNGYRSLTARVPDMAEAHWFLGRAYASQGDPQRAARELQQAIALKPRLIPARLELARALLATGDRAASRAAVEASLEAYPDQPEALALLRQLRGS